MQSFLQKVAQYIIEKHPDGLDDICLILPSKRASLFLKRHISALFQKTLWSPEILSIEEFIKKQSDLKILDDIILLFELYEIHKKIAGAKKQDFDEFSKWGQVLLRDFNEIDMHLASAENLFNYLSDIKSLTHWNPEHLEPTEFQKQYISFFKSLYTYYKEFKERLISQNTGYIGLAFKQTAEQQEILRDRYQDKKIYFIGFNALTKSEETILFGLKKSGKAEIFWDADSFYMSKIESGLFHEAGFFLRKYFKEYTGQEFNWIQDNFGKGSKQINIYGIPKQIGQAKFCGQLILDHPGIVDDKYNSAIVLADENLLFPVLNSLPELKELNATMGVPLNSSAAFDFISAFLEMHYKSETYSKANKNSDIVFHINDIKKVIGHPFINNLIESLLGITFGEYRSIISSMHKSNKIFYTSKLLKEMFGCKDVDIPEFVRVLFSKWENTEQGIAIIKNMLLLIKDAYLRKGQNEKASYKIELEYLFQFSLIFNKIEKFQKAYQSISGLKTFVSLFKQLCKSEKLSLFGEPLQGMQLMGMLETRVLDFKNLILCSANEHILPSSSKQNSFIPFDIKRAFGLPTYREKNAIFAYHFFRLLQKAENIHLLYNTEADVLAGGDKSRFLFQIQEELSAHNPDIQIKEYIIKSEVQSLDNIDIEVPKTKAVLEALYDKATKGFSATGLISYIRCPLQFYYKEIAQIGEYKQTEETIDAATLGQIIHDALQEIYAPLINKVVDVNYLKSNLKNLDAILNSSFSKLYKDGNLKFGKNYLINRIAKIYLERFLKKEIENINSGTQIMIKSLENKYTRNLDVEGLDNTVVLKGFVDRIDEQNGALRIIDYKTGTVLKRDLEVKDINQVFDSPNKEKCFQLMFYSLLLQDLIKVYPDTSCGIFSLKKMSQGYIQLQLPDQDDLISDNIHLFEEGIKNLLKEIFDPGIKYVQTSDLNNCKLCDFKTICNRA